MSLNRRGALALLLAAMAGLLLGLAHRHSLWTGEAFSLATATGHSVVAAREVAARPERGDFVAAPRPVPAEELRPYLEFDDPPAGPVRVVRTAWRSGGGGPLYPLVLNAWLRGWGEGDLALRTLSMVLVLGGVVLVARIGRELGGERTGLLAAALFAMAPLALEHGAEGGAQAMLWGWALLLAWTTLQLRERRGGVAAHVGWVLAGVAGWLTHAWFAGAWGAMAVFLWLSPGGDRRRWFWARVGGTLLAIAPWYGWVATASGDAAGLAGGGARWWDGWVRGFSGEGRSLWAGHHVAELGALTIFVAGGAMALWRSGRGAGGRLGWGLVWLWWLGAGLAGVLAGGRGNARAAYPDFAGMALPAACLLGAGALAAWRGRAAWVALVLVGLCWAPGVAGIYKSRARHGQPMRDVARQVSAYGRVDDLVLVHGPPEAAMLLARYTTTPAGFATWTTGASRLVEEALAPLLRGRRRVLFIRIEGLGGAAPEEAWLRGQARLERTQRLDHVRIEAFRPAGGATF